MLNGVGAATGSSAAGTLRAGDAGHPLKGYHEIADTLESARNSGPWKQEFGYRTITDAAMTSGHAGVTSATADWTSADVRRQIRVNGAGSSGGVLSTVIYQITSSTVAQLQGLDQVICQTSIS